MALTNLLIQGMLVAGFLACAKPAAQKNHAPSACTEGKRIRIAFGEQGGYTGDYNGYRIDDNDVIYRLNRKPAGEMTADSLGKITPEERLELLGFISRSSVNEIHYRKKGRLTYSIEIETDGTGHKVSWPRGDRKAPAAVGKLYKNLRSWIQKNHNWRQ